MQTFIFYNYMSFVFCKSFKCIMLTCSILLLILDTEQFMYFKVNLFLAFFFHLDFTKEVYWLIFLSWDLIVSSTFPHSREKTKMHLTAQNIVSRRRAAKRWVVNQGTGRSPFNAIYASSTSQEWGWVSP